MNNLTWKENFKYFWLLRKHRKELIKLCKHTKDYDWEYLDELVRTKIHHFLEFYELGICNTSDEEVKKVIKSLRNILGYYNIVDECIYDPEAEQKAYENIYAQIGKNIMTWWD